MWWWSMAHQLAARRHSTAAAHGQKLAAGRVQLCHRQHMAGHGLRRHHLAEAALRRVVRQVHQIAIREQQRGGGLGGASVG